MKTKAVRLYGKHDLRLEEFELPPFGPDEILARVISDSICMSSHKAEEQGAAHKRVPSDVAENPVIIGHEFCGDFVEVGEKWKQQFRPGDKFSIQPALNYHGSLAAPGYSYPYIGGDATYIIIPGEVMKCGCLLPYHSDTYYLGSLSEPMSCIVGAFHACYHTTNGSYTHAMGIREGGKLALLAAAGPMGLGAADYAIHADRKPSLVVVTDIDEQRLARAAEVLPVEEAARQGVRLCYVNTAAMDNPDAALRDMAGGGYDEVFVFAPVPAVVEQGDRLLDRDGCLNFFSGPLDPNFSAKFNFYNVHYASTHVVGTSGGNTDDMIESLAMMESGRLNPSAMITHVGGLNCVAETTKNLPDIPGGKKLIYTHIDMPLTPIAEFGAHPENPLFMQLDEIVKRNNHLWCPEAEAALLRHFDVKL